MVQVAELIDKILNEKTLYGDLFPHDNMQLPLEYRRMCKLIHPDVCDDPRATDAFAKLQNFYTVAGKALSSGTWEATNYVEFKTVAGKTLQLKYMYHGIFEIGEYYVCSKHIVYLFDFSKKKYYNNYINQIENLKYADGEMKKMFQPLFPTIVSEHDTLDDQHIIVVSKTEDVYPLRCVMDNFYKGNIPDTHLAWIMSRMMNIACYLKYNKQVHNGINIDNMFVSLQYHTILLLGGWWYAVDEDAKMLGTTKDIYAIMPPRVKADKNASSVTDVESIKAFGRKYLADTAPQAFKDFVNSGSGEDSMVEMEKWDNALIESFGKRKFIKIEATSKQIYNM